jgi:predicted helicase
MRTDLPSLRARHVWGRDFQVFRKYFISSILPSFAEPLLYILALGYGLGFFVGSIQGIHAANAWTPITADAHGDWLKQRDDSFEQFLVMGEKGRSSSNVLFENYSNGVKTNRDSWVYNPSRSQLTTTVRGMIDFYNSEVKRYIEACDSLPKSQWPDVDEFLNFDSTKMSWTREVKEDLHRHNIRQFIENGIVKSLYRPFTHSWMYFNQHFNNCVYQMPRLFPDNNSENLVICLNSAGARSPFSCILSSGIPNLNLNSLDAVQCFPLYLYDEPEAADATAAEPDLFSSIQSPFSSPQSPPTERRRRSAITDAGLAHFQAAYPGETLTKEDIFYYVYGLLHSPDYRTRYADNLSKELPRIPCVKSAADFWAFSRAGRALADLHINYETVEPYPATVTGHQGTRSPEAFYRVEKMKYAKKGDKTTLIYNAYITISDIPLEAYDYIVNGKPALDWVVERQCVKTDKDSGIVNDANAWALETMHTPRYPLDHFIRVITVSIEPMKILSGFPQAWMLCEKINGQISWRST